MKEEQRQAMKEEQRHAMKEEQQHAMKEEQRQAMKEEQWYAMKKEQWQAKEPWKQLDPTEAGQHRQSEYLTSGGADYNSRQPEQREIHSKTHNEDIHSLPYIQRDSYVTDLDGRITQSVGSIQAHTRTKHKTSNRGGADATATKPSPARSLSSTDQQPFSAQVDTRDGVRPLQLCKLTNPRKGMKVVAKRQGGEFDAGTIQYVGKVDDSAEDYVGIELDLPSKYVRFEVVCVLKLLTSWVCRISSW